MSPALRSVRIEIAPKSRSVPPRQSQVDILQQTSSRFGLGGEWSLWRVLFDRASFRPRTGHRRSRRPEAGAACNFETCKRY